MLEPELASCFPFGDVSANCCLGQMEGSACNEDAVCRGLSRCVAGLCTGASGCEKACHTFVQGEIMDCCRPEAFFHGTCIKDHDCQGLRKCKDGFCHGRSQCRGNSSGNKILYDQECLCTSTVLCSQDMGVPCANNCQVWQPVEGLILCSRLDELSLSETQAQL